MKDLFGKLLSLLSPRGSLHEPGCLVAHAVALSMSQLTVAAKGHRFVIDKRLYLLNLQRIAEGEQNGNGEGYAAFGDILAWRILMAAGLGSLTKGWNYNNSLLNFDELGNDQAGIDVGLYQEDDAFFGNKYLNAEHVQEGARKLLQALQPDQEGSLPSSKVGGILVI
jgi:hypothetical protein